MKQNSIIFFFCSFSACACLYFLPFVMFPVVLPALGKRENNTHKRKTNAELIETAALGIKVIFPSIYCENRLTGDNRGCRVGEGYT